MKYGIWPDLGGPSFNPFNPGEPLGYVEGTQQSLNLSDFVSVTVHPKPPGTGTTVDVPTPEDTEEDRPTLFLPWPEEDEDEEPDKPLVPFIPTDIGGAATTLMAVRDDIALTDSLDAFPTPLPPPTPKEEPPRPVNCEAIEKEIEDRLGLRIHICQSTAQLLDITGSTKTTKRRQRRTRTSRKGKLNGKKKTR